MDEVELQRRYYERTAAQYDALHNSDDVDPEHMVSCRLVTAFLQARHSGASILDVGAGTGRFYNFMKENAPSSGFRVTGIEPSEAQRKIAHANGVPPDRHLDGDATNIAFGDNAFDFAGSFGVIHHIKNYRRAIDEMCRVASTGIFMSDCNKFGQGSFSKRVLKNLTRYVGGWRALDYVNTGGKGYHYSEGDGVFYSFSAFDVIEQVREKFPIIYTWPTRPVSSPNLYFGCSHVLLLAMRDDPLAEPTATGAKAQS
jgi:ubiquinone/menaquinone biosynthesis C-methylase UbiE